MIAVSMGSEKCRNSFILDEQGGNLEIICDLDLDNYRKDNVVQFGTIDSLPKDKSALIVRFSLLKGLSTVIYEDRWIRFGVDLSRKNSDTYMCFMENVSDDVRILHGKSGYKDFNLIRWRDSYNTAPRVIRALFSVPDYYIYCLINWYINNKKFLKDEVSYIVRHTHFELYANNKWNCVVGLSRRTHIYDIKEPNK